MKNFIFLLTSLVFAILFYEKDLGVNVLLFNLISFGGLLVLKRLTLPTTLSKTVCISVLTSATFVVYHNTIPSFVLHIINWIIFIGVLNFKTAKTIGSWMYIGLVNTLLGMVTATKSIFAVNKSPRTKKKYKLSLYLVPIGIILIFLLIYRASNPVFDEFMASITDVIFKPFDYINFEYLPIFILGLLLTSPIIFELTHLDREKTDQNSTDFLTRKRSIFRKRSFKIKGLANEYQAGIFLLISLNVLLAVVNFFDIYTVWINFEFEGQTLKAFVHQGTYMLIISILISIGIVLYFFRNNLNFYTLNTKLKTLTYIWIIQNIVLTGSVFARCYHYINHFGLAYKRIGVIVFLLAVIVGLITVHNKVKYVKTTDYLWRVNLLSLFILLNGLTFFNWDVLIAKYNLANYKQSYVHFIYLSKLSDSALYALQVPIEQLEHISTLQKAKFNHTYLENSRLNMNSTEFQERIESRIANFEQRWENQHWLSWNFAEYNCYKQLHNQ